MADATTSSTSKKKTTRKTAAKPAAPATATAAAAPAGAGTTTDHRTEAKSRFNSALEEAKAGAAALKAEAADRAVAYRDQAKGRSEDWVEEAKTYGRQAKGKSKELATEGKAKASEALSSLSRMVSENATAIDEKFGAQYGDYARKASRSLEEASVKLDSKSVDDLSEDAREMVRKSPGLAVGLAAVAGFMLARMFRGSRD
ncbi:hypothetical protein [Pelagerythrobacter aerophilus]|uniref:DUF883 family protein n=1 Tax=Pelagerythrobacter aerophilus TaxID=2306995 RepID=A0A418NJV7_9SPHN|nr:hypothetical protein [Pelagerythrobacter aerophilus]RIV79452.1 hypothetical protein D2V04_05540 [Pelagerythrobacter aerophilus]